MNKTRKKQQESKEQRGARMVASGKESRYARKAAYLKKHGGWGWEYAIPKPW